MKLTMHASIRQQQRGIPPIVIDLLLSHGRSEPAGENTTSYYFDKAARRKVLAYAGTLSRAIEEHLDCYAIVGGNGQVITAAHRLKRFKQ